MRIAILSHLFWQGCDPVEVIHFLGKQGAIYHAHMKDTVLYPENVARYGVLNFVFEASDLPHGIRCFPRRWLWPRRICMEGDYSGLYGCRL